MTDKVYNMTQCRMQRVKDGAIQTAWIPSKFAFAHNIVKLDEDGETWRIQETWNTMPSDKVLERSQDYKRTREASDI
jgi:hypothetical protein